MKGVRNFITGFGLSLFSVLLAGQLYAPPRLDKAHTMRPIKIDLFKKHDTTISPVIATSLSKKVAKHSIISSTQDTNLVPMQSFDSMDNINGSEDDEILSVNIDGIIPIDYEDTYSTQKAEVLQNESDNLAAMLPIDVNHNEFSDSYDPWEIAKGGKYVKNKKLLEQIDTNDNFTARGIQSSSTDEDISYKVAEKIKQSIIFPIPDEILNDENLTPTFIKKKDPPVAQRTKKPSIKQSMPQPSAQTTESAKLIPAKTDQEATKESDTKGLLENISSWFSSNSSDNKQEETVAPPPPSYSSQTAAAASHNNTTTPSSANEEFADFYETLQKTTHDYTQNKILPSELKLSFQPGRAEISGQTLRWLKAFSEAAQANNTYLQVRLDASTSTDIQRKRLNLLYNIFMNNGVDIKKIDTVFSLTEPNAFIIRSLKYK